MTYTISFFTQTDGDDVTLTGETLEELHTQLHEYGDEAPNGSVEVCHEGFTVGWVSKGSWSYA